MIKMILFIFSVFLASGSLFFIGFDTITSSFVLLSAFIIVSAFYSGNKISFFLLIQFVVAFLWCSCSLYYIELGNFISEQNRFGENVGSLIRYVLYMGVFLFSAYFFISCKTISNSITRLVVGELSFFKFVTYLLFWILIALCLLISIVYGLPLLSGMSRFEFYKLIEPLDKVIFMMPVSSFMLGVLFSQSNSRYPLYGMFFLIIFLILFSDKFSGIYGVFIYFMMGFYVSKNIINNTIKYGFTKKVLYVYFPIVIILFIFVVSVGYIYIHGASSTDLGDRVLSRALGLQAHVWYGVDFKLWNSLILPEPSIFFLETNEPIQPAGLEYLMYQVADEKFVDAFREAGIRFTNGFPAIVLISFGYFFSVIVLIILGLIVGFFLYYTFQKVKLLQPIRLLVSLAFYNNILINIFVMGEVYYIYKILGMVCFAIMIYDLLILKQKNIKLVF